MHCCSSCCTRLQRAEFGGQSGRKRMASGSPGSGRRGSQPLCQSPCACSSTAIVNCTKLVASAPLVYATLRASEG